MDRQDSAVTDYPGILDRPGLDRLRSALVDAEFTQDGVAARIGPEAWDAAGREDFRATLAATDGAEDALGVLVRVFLAGQTEPEATVARALGGLPVPQALAAGLVERDGAGLRAGIDLDIYGDWWVVADLPSASRPGRPLPADHVLGVGMASMTLADCTVREPVATALDLGTGCGVQALHLSEHAGSVTATDLSDRALRFAATTAYLTGRSWELVRGDMLAPVADRRFDLVVSNPPFVVGPGVTTHTYRDSGRPGDGVCAELAAAASRILTPGGTLQYLANWVHVAGEDWQDRVTGWFAGTGCDLWVVQREVTEPLDYVRLWLYDAAEGHDPRRAAAWLDWFDRHKIEAVGFGLVTARLNGRADPTVVCEEARQQLDQPVGEQVGAWFDRQAWLAATDLDGLLATAFHTAPDLRLRQEASHSAAGWAVDRQVLELTTGMHWAEEIDPLIVSLVGGCDGETPLRELVGLLAAAHEAPAELLAPALAGMVRHLVERGMLLPAAPAR
ncbi:MAG: methyltransferase [Hamadaea sp.]|nr:methyltransferase [Hamadaea sp.]